MGITSGNTADLSAPAPTKAAAGALLAIALVFSATTTLKLSAAAAGALYWALNALSWAALAASIVASFGIATALAGMIYGYAKKWALKTFVAW